MKLLHSLPFLGYNPFTASIEIKLHSDYANSDSIAKIEKVIKKNTNIQEVLYQKDLIDAVNENIKIQTKNKASLLQYLILIYAFLLIQPANVLCKPIKIGKKKTVHL